MTERPVPDSEVQDPIELLRLSLIGKSERTKKTYRATALRFLHYLEAHGVPPRKATEEHLLTFLNAFTEEWHRRWRMEHPDPREEEPEDPKSTLVTYTAAIVALLHAIGIPVDEKKLKRYRVVLREPKVLLDQDLNDILAYSRLGTNPLMDYAIVAMLAYSGIRLAELGALTRESLVFDEANGRLQSVHVAKGKGGKPRLVPLYEPERVEVALNEYLRNNRDVRGSRRLFPVTGRTVENIVRRAAAVVDEARNKDNEEAIKTGEKQESTLASWVHPHSFRHTLATTLMKRKAPVEAVRKMLGHASLNTTQRYVHLVDTDVIDAIREAREGGKAKNTEVGNATAPV